MEKGYTIPVLDHGYVKLIDWLGDDNSPLEAARMSTGKETGQDPAKDDGLRDYLLRHLHTSPFEFCTLVIEAQMPIFVARQWIRHRTLSTNEFSGRYAEMPDLFYEPELTRIKGKGLFNKQGSEIKLVDASKQHFVEQVQQGQRRARQDYEDAVQDGVANELARINLPVSQYTKWRNSGNLLNWFRFIQLRLHPHAQEEIRVYAQAVAQLIETLWPKCYAVFAEHMLHARTFSQTELQVLQAVLSQPSVARQLETELARVQLLPSRVREFQQKLNLY